VVLTIAAGIVIAFFVIRFILNWQVGAEVQRELQYEADVRARHAETERLRLLGIRLAETNPQLWAEASARVPEPFRQDNPNEKVFATDETGKLHAVWPQELANNRRLRRVPAPKFISDIAREAESICRERGWPPP